MVTVPKVANRPRNEAVEELEKLGLLVTVNEEPSPDVPRGKVIRVNPAEGSELQKNSSVTLTVSSGKEVTEVPDLTGMKLDEATTALEEAGLELNTDVEQVNDEAPAGEIISQNPAGGAQLSKGSKVRVTVSKGQKEVSVPDVSGMDRDRAVDMLSSMDFDVTVNSVDSELPENQVLRVVEQGQKLPKGSQVTLEVSNAMLIQAPDITHSSQQEAESALRAKGWSGSIEVGERIPTSNPIDSNKIGWASASRGDVIRKDETIHVRFWEFDPAALLPQ